MYQTQLDLMYNRATAVFTSEPADHECTYQPGGTTCIAAGSSAGRVLKSGSNRIGQFCWQTFQGKRDKGVIVITSYRVCEDSNPGPLTANRYGWMMLRQEGVQKPNPRKDILTTLAKLIKEKRQEGYRPVSMMDANRDNTGPKGDKNLRAFIRRTGLVDHYK